MGFSGALVHLGTYAEDLGCPGETHAAAYSAMWVVSTVGRAADRVGAGNIWSLIFYGFRLAVFGIAFHIASWWVVPLGTWRGLVRSAFFSLPCPR